MWQGWHEVTGFIPVTQPPHGLHAAQEHQACARALGRPAPTALLPFLPRPAGFPPATSSAELLGGRQGRALAWLGPSTLLLVAGPRLKGEEGSGDVLLEVQLTWPESDPEDDWEQASNGAPNCEAAVQGICYADGTVLRVVPLLAGVGAAVQLADGQVRQYVPAAVTGKAPRLQQLPAGASFPVPCPLLLPSPVLSPASTGLLAPQVGPFTEALSLILPASSCLLMPGQWLLTDAAD
jgi:hypothetical protein